MEGHMSVNVKSNFFEYNFLNPLLYKEELVLLHLLNRLLLNQNRKQVLMKIYYQTEQNY